MYLLNAESVNSIKDAVHYYDCATEKVAYETVGKLEGDVVILSKEEVKTYIIEMEDAVFNGAFAPPTLSFWSQLCDMVD